MGQDGQGSYPHGASCLWEATDYIKNRVINRIISDSKKGKETAAGASRCLGCRWPHWLEGAGGFSGGGRGVSQSPWAEGMVRERLCCGNSDTRTMPGAGSAGGEEAGPRRPVGGWDQVCSEDLRGVLGSR